jgi:transcriptional regulator with XRE-family HTH domain
VTKVRNEKLLRAIGENIRRIRLEKKMSQEDLANDADIPINQIGRIERGEVNTTISTLYVISEALNVSIMVLVSLKIEE